MYVPLKIKLLTDCPVVIDILPVPAEILKLMLFASVGVLGVIVLLTEPLYVDIINGVPVTEYVVSPVKKTPELTQLIVFVPNARVPVNPVIVRV